MIPRGRQPEDGAPPLRGATAAALLLVFTTGSFASAAGIHGCPRHHHHAPGSEALRGAAAHSQGASGETEHPGDDRDGRTCTCLGDCQAGVPAALHASSARVALEPAPLSPVRLAPAPVLRPGLRAEYFLPFPLGPPAA